MALFDYLIMRTPEARLGTETAAEPGKISGSRIALSIAGLIVGIAMSFIVTGIHPPKGPASQQTSSPSQSVAIQPAKPPDTATSQNAQLSTSSEPKVNLDLSSRRLLVVGVISLVICALTYQQLYFSLRLYQKEPSFLIFFVSFQYGYFWQSVLEGIRILA